PDAQRRQPDRLLPHSPRPRGRARHPGVGVSGGTPKGRSKGGDSGARGRRMAEKARGPRREPKPAADREPDAGAGADIGVEARIAAGILLNGALTRRGGLDEARALPAVSGLPGPDRAFARAVAMAALRRLGEIDQI